MTISNPFARKFIHGFFLLFAAASFASAAQWTDRTEYDAVIEIRAEASPTKQLELLGAWDKKFPKSELREARLELYLSAYQALGYGPQMLDTARLIFETDATNPVGMLWCTVLIPASATVTPELLDTAERSARGLLAGMDSFFAADKRPSSATEADWIRQRTQVELLAHRSLGWIAWQKGNFDSAEQEFSLYLKQNPNNAEITAWLGMVTGMDQSKMVPALWQLARASGLRGDDALSAEQLRQINALLEHVYKSYHGSLDGIDQLRPAALTAPAPSADFTIESATVVAAHRAEEELRRTNPELAAWLDLRRKLELPDAEKNFAELRTTPSARLKGTIIRSTPARNPKELVLGMTESMTEDVILKLSTPLSGQAEQGTQITFEGTYESFQPSPLNLTMAADPAQVDGWPDKSRAGSGGHR